MLYFCQGYWLKERLGRISLSHHFTKTDKEDFGMEFEAYCVKCREKRQIKDGKVEETAKGRKMAKGECPVCGTKVTRFLSSKE